MNVNHNENDKLYVSIRMNGIYEKAITHRLRNYINGKRKLYGDRIIRY